MRKITILFFFIVQLSFGNSIFWSKKGHRVVGEVAQKYLTRKARKEISKLLDGQSLASVANHADFIKADKRFREFSAWHYVNFPEDKKYTEVEPSKYGDVIQGIEKCVSIIKNKKRSKEDRAFYLKLLVHFIGDLHQPLHVGRLEDKGGNDIQVQWFSKGSNLHKVWDTNMIEDHGMSYTELANSLPKINKEKRKAIQEGTIYDWVEESQDLANKVYESVEIGEKLSYKYSYVWWTTVEKQLQVGGVRLAKVLNNLF
ncbi:S1/P1 nuclease [uncultured Maribacter sp.]|uniref:S1/P1 nuclease n=1 Tax=uncultured Maribacter sp. TaxID=431308 RepID=UPI002616B094|nr:S1/P1 nuclease [uncultured Maribacter sp.]